MVFEPIAKLLDVGLTSTSSLFGQTAFDDQANAIDSLIQPRVPRQAVERQQQTIARRRRIEVLFQPVAVSPIELVRAIQYDRFGAGTEQRPRREMIVDGGPIGFAAVNHDEIGFRLRHPHTLIGQATQKTLASNHRDHWMVSVVWLGRVEIEDMHGGHGADCRPFLTSA